MSSEGTRLLLKGLASISVAALSGAPGAAVAISFSADLAGQWVERHLAARELRTRILDGLEQWARSENLQTDFGAGIDIAGRAISRHGLLLASLRRLSYDSRRITADIIETARMTDRDWGVFDGEDADDAHAVARRAIGAAVDAVLRDRYRIEAEILPQLTDGFVELRSDLAEVRRTSAGTSADIHQLTDRLISPASALEVRTYLLRRIEDWDVAGWIQPRGESAVRPSQIERTLSVSDADGSRTLLASEALQGNTHVVILGGPGAGKSWLARRIAREAAQAALKQLDAGMDPLDVDIPLFTSWAAWAEQSSGGARGTLIEASFASGLGHSDLGDVSRTDRIKRLLGSTSHAVVIIDALDEAHESGDVEARIHELQSLAGWRSIVTSRPSAWSAKRATRERDAGVFTLEPLDWNRDVPRFISAWFADAPRRADALIEHIRRNDLLRQTSTIPLLLSFYCIHANSTSAESPLPTTNHELFEHVIHQLLISEWSSGGRPRAGEIARAKEVLTGWAWQMVEDSNDRSGLGSWGDRLYPSEDVPEHILRIVDSIAPSAVDSSGIEFRTFRHRTLLEHFVALHIASLSAERAAEKLLPHLWFDPDWDVAVPRAIALHPERDQVRDVLLASTSTTSRHRAAKDAKADLDFLWLRVAADTVPDDWQPLHQDQIHALRIQHAVEYPELTARSVAWSDSNAEIVSMYRQVLHDYDPQQGIPPHDLIRSLHLLDLDEIGRQDILHALTEDFVAADFFTAQDLDLFLMFRPTVEERRRLRDAIAESLPVRHMWSLAPAADALQSLEPTAKHMGSARSAITAAMVDADAWTVTDLATSLRGIDPDDDERATARREITRVLSTVGPWEACSIQRLDYGDANHRYAILTSHETQALRLVQLLIDLEPDSDQRIIALLAQTIALTEHSADPSYEIPPDFSALRPAAEEIQIVRTMIRSALDAADSWAAPGLANALLTCDPSPADRDVALRALSTAAIEAGAWSVEKVISTFDRLTPSPQEWATLRSLMNTTIAEGAPIAACAAMQVLAHLGTTLEEQRTASPVLQEILASGEGAHVRSAATALRALTPCPEDHPALRRALSSALSTDDPRVIRDVVDTLISLGPLASERKVALVACARAMAADEMLVGIELHHLPSGLLQTEEDRTVALEAITEQMLTAAPAYLWRLTTALLQVASAPQGRARVYDLMSTVYARADSDILVYLGGVLASLARSRDQIRAVVSLLRTHHGRAAPSDSYRITRQIRQLSTFDEWMSLLHSSRPYRQRCDSPTG